MEADETTHEPPGAPTPGPLGASAAYRVTFPLRGEVRAEVERAPVPFGDWWRARVCGGARWVVPRPMPWSYAPSETVAVDAAVSLWAIAGQPRFERPADELPPVPEGLAEPADSGAAVLVVARPGRKAPVERQVLESVNRVLRAFIDAVECGAPTLVLPGRDGHSIEIELSSVLELRDARRAARDDHPPEDDES